MTVVVDGTVVAGVAVSELPPHPETTNRKVSATAYFLTVSVCHPSPEGGGVTSEPLGVDTRSHPEDRTTQSVSIFITVKPKYPSAT